MTKGRGYWFGCLILGISLAEMIVSARASAMDELAPSRYFGNGDLKARSIRRAGSEYRPDPNPLRYSYTPWSQDHPIPARQATWAPSVSPKPPGTRSAGLAKTETARILPCAPAAILVQERTRSSFGHAGNEARIVLDHRSFSWSSFANVPSKLWLASTDLGDHLSRWVNDSRIQAPKSLHVPRAVMTAQYDSGSEAAALPASNAFRILADAPAKRPSGPGNMVYSRFEVADSDVGLSSRLQKGSADRRTVRSMGAVTSRAAASDSKPVPAAAQRTSRVPAQLAGWKVPVRSRAGMLQGIRPVALVQRSLNHASNCLNRMVHQAFQTGQSFAKALRIWPFDRPKCSHLNLEPTKSDLDACLEYYSTAQNKSMRLRSLVPGIENGILVSRQVFRNVARVIAPVLLLAESIFHAERDVVNWIQSRFPHSPWTWSNLGGSLGIDIRLLK